MYFKVFFTVVAQFFNCFFLNLFLLICESCVCLKDITSLSVTCVINILLVYVFAFTFTLLLVFIFAMQ